MQECRTLGGPFLLFIFWSSSSSSPDCTWTSTSPALRFLNVVLVSFAVILVGVCIQWLSQPLTDPKKNQLRIVSKPAVMVVFVLQGILEQALLASGILSLLQWEETTHGGNHQDPETFSVVLGYSPSITMLVLTVMQANISSGRWIMLFHVISWVVVILLTATGVAVKDISSSLESCTFVHNFLVPFVILMDTPCFDFTALLKQEASAGQSSSAQGGGQTWRLSVFFISIRNSVPTMLLYALWHCVWGGNNTVPSLLYGGVVGVFFLFCMMFLFVLQYDDSDPNETVGQATSVVGSSLSQLVKPNLRVAWSMIALFLGISTVGSFWSQFVLAAAAVVLRVYCCLACRDLTHIENLFKVETAHPGQDMQRSLLRLTRTH